ncbi:MAG: DNA helicase RecQ [Planctomycetota bacterium]
MQTGPDQKAPAETGDSHDQRLLRALKHTFGYSSFRPHQQSIVKAVLRGRDCFVVMPSGGGKSLCYQLPATLMSGTCVVISPLISLMKDQVDGACAEGISAGCINSSQNYRNRRRTLQQLQAKELDLLYISPERLAMDRFRDKLKRAEISFFAIDEAHCISEWGHDFRPDYLSLSGIKEAFSRIPVAAFTATATPKVQEDIIQRLNLAQPHRVEASFDRPNFFYQVLPKDEPRRQILQFARKRQDESGIVYRTTRDDVEATARMLKENEINALPYHAGFDRSTRRRHQEAFNNNDVDVMVATIAFGMGIDKPNVRYVVHGDLPKNMESYYQETGRAGRDGNPAHCLLLFSQADAHKIRYFIRQMEDEQHQKVASEKLNRMIRFASTNCCRRRQLLNYFGEDYEEDSCGSCDVCVTEADTVDRTREAQILMSAVVRTDQRFGMGKIVDIVTGADTKEIKNRGLDSIKTYGAGAERPKDYWRTVLDELLGHGCLRQTGERYPILKLTHKGKQVLMGDQQFHMVRREKEVQTTTTKAEGPLPCNEDLLRKLKVVRKRIAHRENMPAFLVFHDRTLREMARYFPVTRETMRSIHGVGDVKLDNYADEFIEEISRFIEKHPNASPPPAEERT